MLKLVCYGGGAGFKSFVSHLRTDKAKICGIIDKSLSGGDTAFPVVSVEELGDIDFDYVIICSRNYKNEMIEILIKNGIPEEKIVADCSCVTIDMSYQNFELMRDIMDSQAMMAGLAWSFMLPYKTRNGADYVRKVTLYYVANMLKHYHVSGNLAEVGVFRGDFSGMMSELFPESNIYLFDTFESFPEKDINESLTQRDKKVIEDLHPLFKDTSVEAVLANMPYPNKCIVRKGFFPETAENMSDDIMFSLVSLDTDLYSSINAGLEFFYPRMVRGGMVMIHDYGLDGVREAVDEFAQKRALIPVPVADFCQTVILTK